MGNEERRPSEGGSSAVLVVAIVLAVVLVVPLVLAVVLVLVGGLFFVSVRSEYDAQVNAPITKAGPADPAASGLPVDPGSTSPPPSLTIDVDEMGQLRVDGMEMTEDELRRLIEDRFGDAAEDASATIRAHHETKHADVIRVIDILKEAGISNVNIGVSDHSATPPEPDEPTNPPAGNSIEP